MKYLKLYEKYKFEKQLLVLEKNIEVGDNLLQKLNKINSPLSKKVKSFLTSNDIKDDLKIDKIEYDEGDNKVFTLIDEKGQKRKFKFGKLLKYLGYEDFDKIKGYEVEDFISNFKKADTSNLVLREGEDILKSYLCDNYDDSTGHGNLFRSCMRFQRAQDYLEIYTKNPEKVKCLTLINPKNKKVKGRALIWKLDNGNHFMDRIYTVNKELDSIFKKYADKNNIETGRPSGEVTLNNTGDYDHYPYMDTFQYYTPDTGVLSDDSGDLSLTSTTGGGGRGDVIWSDFMQEEIEESEAVYSHRLDDYIYRHDAVEIFSWHEGPEKPSTDFFIDNDEVHDIDFKSDEFEMFDKAHEDDLVELEYDSKYVLEEDHEIYEDTEWGPYLKEDKFDEIDFDNEDIELFAIKVNWEGSNYNGDYVPYDQCCSAWNEEKKDFVILMDDEFEYDYSEEDYKELNSWNVKKLTETVYVPESFLSNSEALKDSAPFYIDVIYKNFYVKGEQEDVKLHNGIYLPKELASSKCINLDTGYRVLPSMANTMYDSYDDYIKSIRKSIEDAKKNHTDNKLYLPEHKYFIKAFEKGQYLEKNLLRVLNDKTSYTLEEFKTTDFIVHRVVDSEKATNIIKFINQNNKAGTGAFDWKSDILLDLKYVSWLSFYKKDNILVFPYVYSINQDKYLVYRGDVNTNEEIRKYRLYTPNQIMNLIQYGAI